MSDEILMVAGNAYYADRPVRRVTRIERDPTRPGWARLTLSCGHTEEFNWFPQAEPPPNYRRYCPVEGCRQ
jgi:hypothetical protein